MQIEGITVDNHAPFIFIAGPCVVENEKIALESAEFLKKVTDELKIPFIYKSSFKKANRSSAKGFRGLEFHEALNILAKVRKEFNVPVLTDVHEYTPFDEVAEVVSVLQTPAFLCRQSEFLEKVAACHKPINVKKGQFLSPYEMKNVVEKLHLAGNDDVMVCERGFSFGYNNLVVDMRSLAIMQQETGKPVIFDAGHSVQQPGGLGTSSGGKREFIAPLARAAMAVGIAGIFLETHPNPDEALCDGSNMLPLSQIKALLEDLKSIDQVIKGY